MTPATKFFIVEVPATSQAIFTEYSDESSFLVALGATYRRAKESPGGDVFAFRGNRIVPEKEIVGMTFNLGDGKTKTISLPR